MNESIVYQTTNIKDFKTIFGTLAHVQSTDWEDCVATQESGNLIIRAMDASHVSLYDLAYKAEALADTQVRISPKEIWNTGKNFKTDVRWFIGKDHIEFLTDVETVKVNNLPFVPTKEDQTPLPKIDFTEQCIVKYKEFKDALRIVKTKSDFICIGSSLFGRGDTGEVTTKVSGMEKLEETGIYGLELMKGFVDRLQGVDSIQINYAKEKPMKLHINADAYRLDYWLAPRVEN